MSAQKITLQMLQERFVAGLDRRVAHLSGCLASLRVSHTRGEVSAIMDDMMRGFHSLAGIGGTYGFFDITKIARFGEAACQPLKMKSDVPDLEALAGILHSLRLAALAVSHSAGDPSVIVEPRSLRDGGT